MERLALTVESDQAEAVLDELLPLVPAGVHVRTRGEQTELAIEAVAGQLPPAEALERAAGTGFVALGQTTVPDDWRGRRRLTHDPVVIDGRVVLRPEWAPAPDDAQFPVEVILADAAGFGSGSHPTTRLCIQALLRLEPGGSLADLGCGVGTLSVTAAKLGWGPVVGVEIEPRAAEAARRSAELSSTAVTVSCGDVLRDRLPAASTVLANLSLPLIRELAPRLDPPPETAVLSGILDHEADAGAAALAAVGMSESERLVERGWAAVVMRR